jgi:hypothetical protein
MLLRQKAYFQSKLDEMTSRRRALDMTAPVAGRFLVNMPKVLDGKFVRRRELIGYMLASGRVPSRGV